MFGHHWNSRRLLHFFVWKIIFCMTKVWTNSTILYLHFFDSGVWFPPRCFGCLLWMACPHNPGVLWPLVPAWGLEDYSSEHLAERFPLPDRPPPYQLHRVVLATTNAWSHYFLSHQSGLIGLPHFKTFPLAPFPLYPSTCTQLGHLQICSFNFTNPPHLRSWQFPSFLCFRLAVMCSKWKCRLCHFQMWRKDAPGF